MSSSSSQCFAFIFEPLYIFLFIKYFVYVCNTCI
nr:MAG TPA: hypothetical protein [Caudoviricetes sp.]